jgi:hypothetical protein
MGVVASSWVAGWGAGSGVGSGFGSENGASGDMLLFSIDSFIMSISKQQSIKYAKRQVDKMTSG